MTNQQKNDELKELTDELALYQTKKAQAYLAAVEDVNDSLRSLDAGEILVCDDLDNEVYHQCEGISSSKIKYYMSTCGQNFKAKYISKLIKEKEKDYFNMGNAIETLLLEPEKFLSMFIRQPDEIANRNSLDYKIFKLRAQLKDLIVLTSEQWDDLKYFKNKCEQSPLLIGLMSANGTIQRSVFKRDEHTGLIIKCRLDYCWEDIGVDVKSSVNASPRWFNLQAKKLGYAIQDAMYSDIANLNEFHFMTIESALPFTITYDSVFDIEMKNLGYYQYRCGLMEIKASTEADEWKPYTRDTNIIKATQYDLVALDVYKQRYDELMNIIEGN